MQKRKDKNEVFYNADTNLRLEAKTFKELAEYIFKRAVKANGFRFSPKGKKGYVMLWKDWWIENISDVELCRLIARDIVKSNDFYYKSIGRRFNKRDLYCLVHKVERHSQQALGIKYNPKNFTNKNKREYFEKTKVSI